MTTGESAQVTGDIIRMAGNRAVGVRPYMPPGLTRIYILSVASGANGERAILSLEFPDTNNNGAHVHRGRHGHCPRCQ